MSVASCHRTPVQAALGLQLTQYVAPTYLQRPTCCFSRLLRQISCIRLQWMHRAIHIFHDADGLHAFVPQSPSLPHPGLTGHPHIPTYTRPCRCVLPHPEIRPSRSCSRKQETQRTPSLFSWSLLRFTSNQDHHLLRASPLAPLVQDNARPVER